MSRAAQYREGCRKPWISPTTGRTPRYRPGTYNDFLFVTLLRSATLTAVRAAGADGLAPDEFGRRVMQAHPVPLLKTGRAELNG